MLIYIQIILFSSHLLIGVVTYLWLQFQCTDVETQAEYNRSHNELTKFLGEEETLSVLSSECMKAIIELQGKLRTREHKLAAYQRMNRKNTMDACTTSPAEANNFCIKHIFKCNFRKKIENSMKQVCQGTDRRLIKQLDAAKQTLSKRNAASRAPTVAYLTQRGQSLGDRNFDNSLKFKSAQVGPTKFIAVNCDLVDPDDTQDVDDFTALKLGKRLCTQR